VTPSCAALLEVECPETFDVWELAAAQPEAVDRINVGAIARTLGLVQGSAIYRHLDRLVWLGALDQTIVRAGDDLRGCPCGIYRLTQPFPGRFDD